MDITLASASTKTLPSHGRIGCRKCFTGEGSTQMVGKWQMVNDPAAWGSTSPKVLILGFSKGFTQADAFRSDRFEDIPFKKMRPRLTEVLRLLGLLGKAEIVDQKMVASESEIGFGSLVRCSLSRLNARGVLECTGQVMPKAFVEEISTNLKTCAQTYLGDPPSSVRLVLKLGTTDSYIKGCRNIVRSLYGRTFSDIDEVSYRTAGIVWVHASHPLALERTPRSLDNRRSIDQAGPETEPRDGGRSIKRCSQLVGFSGSSLDDSRRPHWHRQSQGVRAGACLTTAAGLRSADCGPAIRATQSSISVEPRREFIQDNSLSADVPM